MMNRIGLQSCRRLLPDLRGNTGQSAWGMQLPQVYKARILCKKSNKAIEHIHVICIPAAHLCWPSQVLAGSRSMSADADSLEAREAMEYDVCIVGAGPAGLSAAIRLKQVSTCCKSSRDASKRPGHHISRLGLCVSESKVPCLSHALGLLCRNAKKLTRT